MVLKLKLMILFINLPLLATDGEWKQIYAKDGITAYSRAVADSSIVEFKGTGRVNSNLVRILAVWADSEHSHEWIDKNMGIGILQVINKNERIYHSKTRAPFPFKNRDFVAHSVMSVDEKNGVLTIQARETEHPSTPPNPDFVRMPFTRVKWSFTPLQENDVYLEFTVHADPGGTIPDWLVNITAKEIPYNTIRNLRARVGTDKVSQKFIDIYKPLYWNLGWQKRQQAQVPNLPAN